MMISLYIPPGIDSQEYAAAVSSIINDAVARGVQPVAETIFRDQQAARQLSLDLADLESRAKVHSSSSYAFGGGCGLVTWMGHYSVLHYLEEREVFAKSSLAGKAYLLTKINGKAFVETIQDISKVARMALEYPYKWFFSSKVNSDRGILVNQFRILHFPNLSLRTKKYLAMAFFVSAIVYFYWWRRKKANESRI